MKNSNNIVQQFEWWYQKCNKIREKEPRYRKKQPVSAVKSWSGVLWRAAWTHASSAFEGGEI